MKEYKIPCPKCGYLLRHRVISGLRWCANPNCPSYKGIPPIKVSTGSLEMGRNLTYAMGKEAWEKVAEEIKGVEA